MEFPKDQFLVHSYSRFLIYNNDLNDALTHSKVHHFTDDTNILYISTSLKDTKQTGEL